MLAGNPQSKRTFVFRKYYEKYKHLWILLYFFVYMAWFNYVEKTVTTHFHVIHVPIDDYIPFCEYFVIPYLLWFPFVGWGIAYMALHNKTALVGRGNYETVGCFAVQRKCRKQ